MPQQTSLPYLLFKVDGTIERDNVYAFTSIATKIGAHFAEMTYLGIYPVNPNVFAKAPSRYYIGMFKDACDSIVQLDDPMSNPALVRDRLYQVQLFVDEVGRLENLDKNPFFDDGTDDVLYGDVLMLLGHCDDLPYML